MKFINTSLGREKQGCNMIRNLALPENVKDGSQMVVAANKGSMNIRASGTAKLYPTCKKGKLGIAVNDVHFVPELSTNVLVVVQIVKKGYAVMFVADGCYLLIPEGAITATGVIENDLFKLDQSTGGDAMLCSVY